jgi:hypothetical protein
MRITFTRFSLTLLALALVFSFAFAAGSHIARAQDATPDMMMAHVVCDADLILSLYTAENNFGFAAVMDKMMADPNMAAMVKVHAEDYDKGQFEPLFASMMSMMDSSMATTNSMMSEDTMNHVVELMSMSMDDMEKQMMESMPASLDTMAMTTLAPATVTGEPAECTALRDELRQFYTALAYSSTAMPAAK